MIYDNLMNAGSMPSRARTPSEPAAHERSGRLVTKTNGEPKSPNESQVSVVFSASGLVVTAKAG